MKELGDLWSAFAVCYAIGYMLWVRPRIQGNQRKWDVIFYASLIVFSAARYLA